VDHGEAEVTREFKLEAVRLIKERGVSYAQASQDLGVHTSQLRIVGERLHSRGFAETSAADTRAGVSQIATDGGAAAAREAYRH
jgi:transposase-like protein